jgi:hypothetical protein
LNGSLVSVAVAVALLGGAAEAQDLEPRAYSNAPVGLNFLIAGYSYSEGDVSFDPSVPLDDAEIDLHVALLAYARTFGVFGQSAKVDVILPYGWVSGSAIFDGMRVSRRVDGLGDPRFRVSVNLFGAPALDLQEFRDYEQDVIVGASVQVSAPLGQYDSDKLVNLGTNRWSVKPDLGVSKRWWGRLTTEVTGSVTFYTDNDRFFGGSERTQDPLYAVQGHLIYGIWREIWAALDATWYAGGRTEIDGVRRDDRQESTRVGATLAVPVSRYVSVKLFGSSGLSARTGGDFDAVGVALQGRWGGGL